MTYSLTEDGSSTITTAVITFSTVDGSLIVSTNDLTKDGFSKTMVITVTSTDTLGASKTATDTFVLTLQDVCKSSVLTAPNFGTTNYPWDLYAQQTMPFSAMTGTVTGCGVITYTVNTIDNTVYTISGTDVVA